MPRAFRRGLVTNAVVLSVLLVLFATIAVSVVIIQALGRQIEQAADRRLFDTAAIFSTDLEDRRSDLLATGAWLLRDPRFIAAVRQGELADIQERLALALRLNAIDEVLVADTNANVIARLRVDATAAPGAAIAGHAGFLQANAGRIAHGITGGSGEVLQEAAYLPVESLEEGRIVGVLHLASFLDQHYLEHLQARTGLDFSLFLGEKRLITTLDRPDGAPLLSVGPDPRIFREVVEGGRRVTAWRELPIGRFRSHYFPLNGPDGIQVGMVAISLRADILAGELYDTLLPTIPVTLLIMLTGAVLAYLLTRRIRRPMLTLTAAAARLRAGDINTPIPDVQEAELAPLARELELARSHLQHAREASAREEASQQALFGALRDSIITTDLDGRIVSFNPAAAAFFGGPARLQGRSIDHLLPAVSLAQCPPDYQGTVYGTVTDTMGHTLDVEVSRVLLSGEHVPASVVYVIHDVSRHVALNRMREQLLYSVAHELRGPMSVLDNVLEILATEYGEMSAAELDQLFRSARRTTTRLQALMEDLLSAGSIESGRFLVNPRPVSSSLIVNEAMEMAGPELETRGQRIEHRPASNAQHVLADERYARQVLFNLLMNASKYSPAGGVIHVQVEEADGYLRFTVEDHGPGIPAKQRAGLFERFYRLQPGNEEPGVGLGLAIAKGIVEAHGGSIDVESQVGVGTKVWFTLPVASRVLR